MSLKKTLWQKLGIKLSTQKSVILLFVSGIALLLFCLIFFALIPILTISSSQEATYFIDIFVHRGPIPYFIVVFFGLSIGFLLKNIIVLSFENYAFDVIKDEIKESDDLPTKCIFSDSLSFLNILNNEKLDSLNQTLIYRRISQGMQHLLNTQDTNAMNEYFKRRSDIEYSEMESGFSTVKYFNWLIPTLGFIGTVLGIGVGIAGFAQVIINADNFNQVKEFLPGVTRSLGVAFDTTFLALIISVIVMFITSYVTKSYENLIESLDIFCLDEISSRFKLHSTVAEQLKGVLREIKEDIDNISQGNRIEIVNSLDNSINQLVSSLEQINFSIQNYEAKLDVSPLLVLLQNVNKSIKRIDNKHSLDKILKEIILLRAEVSTRNTDSDDLNTIDQSRD